MRSGWQWRKPRKLLAKFSHLTIPLENSESAATAWWLCPSKASWIPFSRNTARLAWCSCHQITPPPCRGTRSLSQALELERFLQADWKQQHSPTLMLRGTTSPIFAHPLGGDMEEWQDTTQQSLQKLQLLNWKVGIIHPSSEGSFLVLPILAKETWCLYAVGSHSWGPGLSYRLEGIHKQCWSITLLFF